MSKRCHVACHEGISCLFLVFSKTIVGLLNFEPKNSYKHNKLLMTTSKLLLLIIYCFYLFYFFPHYLLFYFFFFLHWTQAIDRRLFFLYSLDASYQSSVLKGKSEKREKEKKRGKKGEKRRKEIKAIYNYR
ncbi:Uncharacterized protein TCM_036400 [Theobroma cacao]|uniref:Uncharacterized protein n=1 Tax=Theobroma cacao TaxID=3641 RepID=A0A061FJL7_THECC|nr:Uncharacterized protein TCM_036400 [Theobroma cacao]